MSPKSFKTIYKTAKNKSYFEGSRSERNEELGVREGGSVRDSRCIKSHGMLKTYM